MIADLLRFVVIALSCVVVGAVLVVIRLHFRAWRRAPKPHGLVPLHVWLISTAHLCFVVAAAVGVLVRFGQSMNWLVVPYIVGSVLTLIALGIIGNYQRRRVVETRQVAVAVEVVQKSEIGVDDSDAETPT